MPKQPKQQHIKLRRRTHQTKRKGEHSEWQLCRGRLVLSRHKYWLAAVWAAMARRHAAATEPADATVTSK